MTATLYLDAADRKPFFADEDGRWSVFKDVDSVQTYTIDWSRALGSDTISTSAWTVDSGNATHASDASTTTTTSTKVSKTDSVLKNVITTAGGQTLIRRVQFIGKEM